jgi:hypothetical protein
MGARVLAANPPIPITDQVGFEFDKADGIIRVVGTGEVESTDEGLAQAA